MARKKAVKKTTKKTTKKKSTVKAKASPKKRKAEPAVKSGTDKVSVYERYYKLRDEIPKSGGGGDIFRLSKDSSVKVRFFCDDVQGNSPVFVLSAKHWLNKLDPNESAPLICTDGCRLCAMDLPDKLEKRIRPAIQYLSNIVLRNASGEDEQKILQFPKTAFESVVDCMEQADEEGLDNVFDHNLGRDFRISRHDPPAGKKGWVKYKVLPSIKSTPIGMEVTAADLTRLVQSPDEAEMDRICDLIQAVMDRDYE